MTTDNSRIILEKINVLGEKRVPMPFFLPKITQGLALE
jgi:hypothetical protein